jgi:putative membrane protein insertion efficiency factor
MAGIRPEEDFLSQQHSKASPRESKLAPSQAVLLAMLEGYRRWLSPLIHAIKPGGCRYLPTCSEYASLAIATHGSLRGVLLASWRLLRCNPFARGGLDPVPSKLHRG